MRRVPVLMFLLFLSPDVLDAQSTNASVNGRVTDPSKAVIMDAKVAAINLDTNVRYDCATNASGEFYLTNLNLPAGSYRMDIGKTGFKKLIKPEVTLHIQDTLATSFQNMQGVRSGISRTLTCINTLRHHKDQSESSASTEILQAEGKHVPAQRQTSGCDRAFRASHLTDEYHG